MRESLHPGQLALPWHPMDSGNAAEASLCRESVQSSTETPSLPAPLKAADHTEGQWGWWLWMKVINIDFTAETNSFSKQERLPDFCSSPAQWPHHMAFCFPLLSSNFFFSGISSPGNKTVSRGSWVTLSSVDLHHTEQRQQMVILH